MKHYYSEVQCGSRSKYIVRTHDGVTHKDGSPFWDIHIMSNKKLVKPHCRKLEADGYTQIDAYQYGQAVSSKITLVS